MKTWHLLASALAGIALTLAVTGFPKPALDDPNVEDKWDLVFAEVLTVSEMDRLAAGEPVFYQGSLDRWHYFRVGSSGYYRLRKAEATIPTHGFDGDGTSELADAKRYPTQIHFEKLENAKSMLRCFRHRIDTNVRFRACGCAA